MSLFLESTDQMGKLPAENMRSPQVGIILSMNEQKKSLLKLKPYRPFEKFNPMELINTCLVLVDRGLDSSLDQI